MGAGESCAEPCNTSMCRRAATLSVFDRGRFRAAPIQRTVITGRVDVAATDPSHPDVPARDVRRIDTERFIHVEHGQLFTRQATLWPRIIPTRGRLHLHDAREADNTAP